MLYAGIDTHKIYSRVVVTDSHGSRVAQGTLQNTQDSFREFFLRK